MGGSKYPYRSTKYIRAGSAAGAGAGAPKGRILLQLASKVNPKGAAADRWPLLLFLSITLIPTTADPWQYCHAKLAPRGARSMAGV